MSEFKFPNKMPFSPVSERIFDDRDRNPYTYRHDCCSSNGSGSNAVSRKKKKSQLNFQVKGYSSPLPASSSISPTLSLVFSSLYECSCRFHSSTLAVDSCSADVSRALLFFSVESSTSHFLALAEDCASASLRRSFSYFSCASPERGGFCCCCCCWEFLPSAAAAAAAAEEGGGMPPGAGAEEAFLGLSWDWEKLVERDG